MHCWFCESPIRWAGPGQAYCPLAACPACKETAPAYALLDGPETKRWQRMREAGTLRRNMIDAGLIDPDPDGDVRAEFPHDQQFLAAVRDGEEALRAGRVVDHAMVVSAFERIASPKGRHWAASTLQPMG